MSKDLTPTQKITFAAMLTALSVIATFIAKTIPMGSFTFLRFSLTPALVVYTSLTLGPLYGAIVGGLADLIPALAYQTGEYNFLITIVYILLGVLPWLLEKLTRHFRSALRKPYLFYVVLALIFVITVVIFYATDWLDKSFGQAAYWGKPTILVISFVLDIGLCIGLYFTNHYYQKRILEHPDVPSPNEIATIALVSEVVMMDLAKALAFWLFYNWVASSRFPISYGVIFSMLFLGAPVDVFFITFMNSWLLLFTKRFIHAYGGGNPENSHHCKSFLVDDKNSSDDLSEDEKEEDIKDKKARIGWIIFFSVVIVIMVICIVVIRVIQGQPASSPSGLKAISDSLHFLFFHDFSSLFI
ncbi:MAG: hypothetical protein WCS90_01565 [Bacilli bacterium]